MDFWRETAAVVVADNPESAATAASPAITTMRLDPFKDLVWVGDSTGRISSYVLPHLRPYTAFPGHSSAIKAIEVSDKYVHSLSQEGVRVHRRTGQLKSHDPTAQGNVMLLFENDLLVGNGNRINRHTIEPPQETGTFEIESDGKILFMGMCSPNVVLGLDDGTAQVVDTMTFECLYSVRCHTGPLTDMDCRKNVLMTCGYSARRYGLVTDQVVFAHDIRFKKPLPLLNITTGASFVRIHPKSPTNCIVLGPTGQLSFLDAKNPSQIIIHQVALTGQILSLDITSTADGLAIAEDNGILHFWSRVPTPDINALPKGLDLPASLPVLPTFTEKTPLSAIGMPFYNQELLSSWSYPLVYDARFKQAQQRRSSLAVPRFISEKERMGLAGEDSFFAERDNSLSEGKIPKFYRQLRIHYSKFGVDDFDFRYYNRTRFSGLETQVMDGTVHCNALLQLLRWCPQIHKLALTVFAQYNWQPIPILGELAILFDMLHKARGRQCRASNFLATLVQRVDAGPLFEKRPINEHLDLVLKYLLNAIADEKPKDSVNDADSETGLRDGVAHLEICAVNVKSRMYGACGIRTDKFESVLTLDAPSGDLRGLSVAFSRTTETLAYCEKCKRSHPMAEARQICESLPPVLFISVQGGSALPEFGIQQRPDKRGFKVTHTASEGNKYTLQGYVAQVDNHSVTIVKTDDGKWYLFNDFLVAPLPEKEVFEFYEWKKPAILMYSSDSSCQFDYDGWKKAIDTRLLYSHRFTSGNLEATSSAKPLQSEPVKGQLCALDAEFVLLGQEVAECHSDGTKSLVQPQQLSLARVSVLRGQNPDEGEPFMDDFVETCQPVVDYLTRYSGIEPGDLDPNCSHYGLVTRATAIRRLWLLLNLGCVFIGHALNNDFRTINLHVPPEQVIDTVDLYYNKQLTRRLGLKFLVWAVLGEHIQTGNHNSIEDALSALKLYNKYKELEKSGELETTLAQVYAKGQLTNFKVPK